MIYCRIINFAPAERRRIAIYSTIVVSAKSSLSDALRGLLPDGTLGPVDTAATPTEARAVARERTYELYFINALPGDESAIKLAADAADAGAVVLLLLAAEVYDSEHDHARSYGVLTLKKPVAGPMLAEAADFMCAMAERQRRVFKRTATAEAKLEDMKLVNRAKWLLIDNLKMTEADAHRYIERQAMDRCIPKREVAESIIKTYKDA